MQTNYPIMLDLTNRRCLVVGGGEVAARKIESLLHARAQVTVISPDVVPSVAAWSEAGKLCWLAERYERERYEVKSFALVIAATNHPETNLEVYDEVRAVDGWINIVDRPDLCNYIVPSVIHRGKLVISVSTSGASPSLAKKLKRRIEQVIGPEYEAYLEFLAEMRQQVLQRVSNPKERKEIFQRLLEDDYVIASDEQRYKMAADLLQGNR